MKHNLLALLITCFCSLTNAQTADIRGNLMDESGYEVYQTAIQLKQEGVIKQIVYSDSLGDFAFSKVEPGKYSFIIETSSYKPYLEDVILQSDQVLVMNIILNYLDDKLPEFVKKVRRAQKNDDDGIDGPAVDTDPIKVIGYKVNVDLSRGGRLSVGKNRPSATVQFANSENTAGIGMQRISMLGLGNIRILDQGVSARFGGFTGGGVVFESAPVKMKKSTIVRMQTTSLFDKYHHNKISGYWNIPILIDSVSRDGYKRKWVKLGTTVLTSYQYKGDPNPNYQGISVLSSEKLASIRENPLQINEATGKLEASANFIAPNDLEEQSYRNNAARHDALVEWRTSIQPNLNMRLDLINTYQFTHRNIASTNNLLMNWENNPTQQVHYYNGIAKFSHTIKSPYNIYGEPDTVSTLVRALSYFLEFNYQRTKTKTYDKNHDDDYFSYGHTGSFSTIQIPVFELQEGVLKNGSKIRDAMVLTGFRDSFVGYNSGNVNNYAASFNQSLFNQTRPTHLNDFQTSGALLNGFSVPSIYSLYNNVGTPYGSYNKTDRSRLGITARMDVQLTPFKNKRIKHDIEIGLNVQRDENAYYNLSASSLWQLMPLLVNTHIQDMDLDNPNMLKDKNGVFLDTVLYQRLVQKDLQRNFDSNLRDKLIQNGARNDAGELINERTMINIQSLDPKTLNLDMFSADELLNNGNPYVRYSGYDHLGNRVHSKKGITNFLTNSDTRHVDGYNPIRSAIWAQDRFVFKDLVVRLGVRFERFDANQPVLKDAYNLYAVKQAGEITELGGKTIHHPISIGKDYAVYVNNIEQPTQIVGYRKDETWYNANGLEIDDPNLLAQLSTSGRIQPYLVDPEAKLTSDAFGSYSPIHNLLPRISFTFPLNTTTLMYANYDQLSQQPLTSQVYVPYLSYYQWHQGATNFIPNAKLKPRLKTEYNIGIKQLLGDFSSINISASYAQVKNDFNLVRLEQAYPHSYTTYGNIDFSTIKRYISSFEYNDNKLFFNLSYALQFADGTGSNSNSAAALIQSGQPNLRSLFPLAYDNRHTLKGNFSYRFGHKEISDSAVVSRRVLKSTSISMNIQAMSGRPYTAFGAAISEAQGENGVLQRSSIKGNPFGHRLPWKVYADIRIDKTVKVSKNSYLGVYLIVTNPLNLRTVENVYSYSGLAEDDGYLNSPQGQQQVQNQLDAQTFVDLYKLRLNNANHLARPRQFTLGLQWNI